MSAGGEVPRQAPPSVKLHKVRPRPTHLPHTNTAAKANTPPSLICKHWLRGLCKKGTTCEFLHEYNLRLMPECTQFARYGTCSNGSDCLYLHIHADAKKPPCPHYERGFCPLGPHCAARHVKRKAFCPLYMAGFCPDGRDCARGAHPKWTEKEALPKPEVRKILSKEEQEAEKARLTERMEKEREEEEREREERGLPGRRDFGGRGRGRGRGEWRGGRPRGRY